MCVSSLLAIVAKGYILEKKYTRLLRFSKTLSPALHVDFAAGEALIAFDSPGGPYRRLPRSRHPHRQSSFGYERRRRGAMRVGVRHRLGGRGAQSHGAALAHRGSQRCQ